MDDLANIFTLKGNDFGVYLGISYFIKAIPQLKIEKYVTDAGIHKNLTDNHCFYFNHYLTELILFLFTLYNYHQL